MGKLKDPAFLFYPESFLVGVMDMEDAEVGIYIKLLCRQHQRGHISKKTYERLPDAVQEKFIEDNDGKYYNERLEYEIERRKNWTTSRRENGSKGGRPKKEYCGLTKAEWEALSSEERMDLYIKTNK